VHPKEFWEGGYKTGEGALSQKKTKVKISEDTRARGFLEEPGKTGASQRCNTEKILFWGLTGSKALGVYGPSWAPKVPGKLEVAQEGKGEIMAVRGESRQEGVA